MKAKPIVTVLGYVPPFNELKEEEVPGLEEALDNVDETALVATLNKKTILSLFTEKDASDEFLEFCRTGRSNGRASMQYARLRIPAESSYPLHAHPNIEFISVLDGTLYEHRLQGLPPTRQLPSAIYPLSLSHLKPDDFKTFVHTTGSILVNEIGSVHQSFTKHDGCDLFVLWGGGHADLPPSATPHFLFKS